MPTVDDSDRAFRDAVAVLGPALLSGLAALEEAQRRLHPPVLPLLARTLAPLRERVDRGIETLRAAPRPEDADELAETLLRTADFAAEALRLLVETGVPEEGVVRILTALRCHCRAQETLYPLRRILPPVDRFFLEPAQHAHREALDPEPTPGLGASVGLHHASNELGERGGFSLYVPESYRPGEPRPLVVALHGGSGHGRDFLWTWMREARSRRCLLLSPTSRGSTWSFHGPDVDARSLQAMLDFVFERWQVDPTRVLLTGLSDGATYTLLHGLQSESRFTALAPISGVLHPRVFATGDLARARGRRIYLVHGRLDWMFPIELARMAESELRKVDADLTFRELEDLSHTYPREENAHILSWMGVDGGIPSAPEAVAR